MADHMSWDDIDDIIADRIAACIKAFDSDDGRELATEKITPGLFWEMLTMLKVLNASPPTFAIGQDVAALLSKLEPQK